MIRECSRCWEFHDIDAPCDTPLPAREPEPELHTDTEDSRCELCGRRMSSRQGICGACEETMCAGCGVPVPVGIAMCGQCAAVEREQDWGRYL